ncbi:DNA adenine methylase [Salinisphaera orenii]|uniref:DNA adenine methylase n=1 Tax=Salinisphaera orenii TaxID=856731 RepID=UPI000F4C82F3|nr:DNA adenine methylase [Salinisphaera orenii]
MVSKIGIFPQPKSEQFEAVELVNQIYSAARNEPNYWDFRGRARRDYCHGWMSYPAMMVPEMQGALIDCLLKSSPNISRILDPFVGSGTVLGEAMLRGKSFVGSDINPLAILCCKAKIDFFEKRLVDNAILRVAGRLSDPRYDYKLVDFPGDTKWFSQTALKSLSKISTAIRAESESWIRRFLWVSLSDLVRLASNTRRSTYKLHVKADRQEIGEVGITNLFLSKCKTNADRKEVLWRQLSDDGLVSQGALNQRYQLSLQDSRALEVDEKADLVVTSPPYGDNKTTVTYGQYSFLPLQFIDLDDIEANFDRSLASRQSSIDTASLGGSLSDMFEKRDFIASKSWAFRKSLSQVSAQSSSGEKRLVSFFYDLYQSAQQVLTAVSLDGFLMLTLGNRKIAGIRVPLDRIVCDFLTLNGATEIVTLPRSIPNKRMPGSMSEETVLVMRKHQSD